MPRRLLDDWLEGFMFYTKGSECPDSYLQWSALHTISAAVQRKTFVPWVYTRIYPNVYIVLVGPPGITHKNAAINFSRKLLWEASVPLASEAVSKEKLGLQMEKRSGENDALAVLAPEFNTFIGVGSDMMKFLTRIYDCDDDFEYATKGGGELLISKPYLTLFSGATPGWMADEFDMGFVDSGFAARTIFIGEFHPRFRRAFADVTREMRRIRQHLVHDLEIISTIEGEFEWKDDSREWFRHWYEDVLPLQDIDYRLRGYQGRKPTHLLRVVQLVTLMEGSTLEASDLAITVPRFKKALKMLEALEPGMRRVFKSVGRNPYANDLERIAIEIENAGGMPWSEILEKNSHSLKRDALDEVMRNLVDMGKIRMEQRSGTRWYVPIFKE